MAFIVGGSLAASARTSNGPGAARIADAIQPCGPPCAMRWHAWQPAMSPPPAPVIFAKASVECGDESAPGLANFARNGPHKLTNNTPAVEAATESVKILRLARRLRVGTHFGMARAHVPSGRGPISQGPPRSAVRVQRQRPLVSPSLISNTG